MVQETDETSGSESRIRAEDGLRAFYTRDDYAAPLDAEEIREHPGVGWAHATAHNKLQELEETGKLKARKVGSRGKVWWIPLRRESVGVEALPPESNPFPASPEQILEYLEDIGEELPEGSNWSRHERAEAVLSAYLFLQNQEGTGAMANRIKEYCYEDCPVATETDEMTAQKRQWVRIVRPILPHLPGVESAPGRGGGRWHFVNPHGELARTLDREIDPWIYEKVEISSRIGEDTAERERALVQIAYEYIKHKGSARRSDLKEELPSYRGHYKAFKGLWNSLLYPALKACPKVSHRKPGSGIFEYTGATSE